MINLSGLPFVIIEMILDEIDNPYILLYCIAEIYEFGFTKLVRKNESLEKIYRNKFYDSILRKDIFGIIISQYSSERSYYKLDPNDEKILCSLDDFGFLELNIDECKKRSPLIIAIKTNKPNMVLKMLDLCGSKKDYNNFLVNHRSEIYPHDTPLITICRRKVNFYTQKIINILLDHNVDLNMTNEYGESPLIHLCRCNCGANEDMIIKFIGMGANINFKEKCGTTILIWACRNGWEKLVDILLKMNVDINQTDNNQNFPLDSSIPNPMKYETKTIKENKRNIFRRLILEKNIDIERGFGNQKNQLLIEILCRKEYDLAQFLLMNKNVHIKNNVHKTTLVDLIHSIHDAPSLFTNILWNEDIIFLTNENILAILKNTVSNISITNYFEGGKIINFALEYAAKKNYNLEPKNNLETHALSKIIIKMVGEYKILSYGLVNVNRNKIVVPKYLMDIFDKILLPTKDCDIQYRNMTPFYFACYHGLYDVAKKLLNKGADLNAWGKDDNYYYIGNKYFSIHYNTPLIKSIYFKDNDIFDLLMENNADINKRDSLGRTPLIIAAIFGRHNMAMTLMDSHGILIHHKDHSDKMAINYAIEKHDSKMITILSANVTVDGKFEWPLILNNNNNLSILT
jgi:ankyrin repeat protein